jgi:GNAT superfamily N-acetyltransferase
VEASSSARARQLESLFDIPRAQHQAQRWRFDAPYEERDWNVGLLVGPSGSGKSTILREHFGRPPEPSWDAPSVIDTFDPSLTMRDIADACQAVGFNTVPAWLRPYSVLSMGERFRVELARALVDGKRTGELVLVDEFTSVVDRQVAKIGAYAVSKYVRRHKLRAVLATCHYDVLDWLQPDWTIEPADERFTWRSVQPRPRVEVTVAPADYTVWRTFAPYHYLSADLNKAARCYAAYVDGRPVAFAGVLYRPHAKVSNVWGISRIVTLPDWQGLGLAFVLMDALGGAYRAAGQRLRMYPAHPALIRSMDRSAAWSLHQKPGFRKGGVQKGANSTIPEWRAGGRPCAVFEYVGLAMPSPDATRLLGLYHPRWQPTSPA